MNMRQPLLLQHLFQVSNLEDVSWQRLESFVKEYPAFGIGHYLLSRKLRADSSDKFPEETQLTSLYFTNPYWLEWLLHHGESNGVEMAVTSRPEEEVVEVVEQPEERVEAQAPQEVVEESETPGAVGVVTLAEEAFAVGPEVEQAHAQEVEEPARMEEEPVIEEASAPAVEAPEPAPAVEAPEPTEPTAADQLLQNLRQARELRESLHRINQDFDGESEMPAPTAVAPVAIEEAPPAVVEPVATEAQAPAPVIVNEPAIVFEPYHTIDYFASQGIKLTLDENPGDRLGRQLKSFTEWLKVMRRLPQKETMVIPDRVAEQAIRDIAEHSIESKEVVTETMAEVFEKQGMRDAARAVYEKLSLLNPDKRGYFAAKIEQLNIP